MWYYWYDFEIYCVEGRMKVSQSRCSRERSVDRLLYRQTGEDVRDVAVVVVVVVVVG